MEYRLVKYVSFVLLLLLAVNGSSYAQVKEKKYTQYEEALEQARLSNLNSAQELSRIIGS